MIDISRLRHTDLAGLQPGEILLPYSKHGAAFVIGELEKRAVAIFLSGQYKFHAFVISGDTTAWQGMATAYSAIEVDYEGVASQEERFARPGDIVLKEGTIYLAGLFDGAYRSAEMIRLHGPEVSRQAPSLFFASWDLVLRDEGERKVLLSIRADAA